jgi:hypothetical protein
MKKNIRWNKKVFICNLLKGFGWVTFFYIVWFLVDWGMAAELGF